MAFAADVLRLDAWSRQAEIFRAVAEHPRVAVRSGHKVGKSTCAAALALWFVLTKPGSRVVLTAPTYRQIKGILWREFKSLYGGARWHLGGELHQGPDSGLQLPDGREVIGFSTKEPERMSGISGTNVQFVVDEASGVPEEIFEAIEGNRAGGARVVMFSNPTRTSGTFFDAFNSKRQFWRQIHVSSEESPNVAAGNQAIAGLATAEWVAEKKLEWGVDSPLYAVRVLGNFPSQATNAVVGLLLVEAAGERWPDTEGVGELIIGVDVARFGDDDSVIQPLRGMKAYEPIVIHGQDTVQVAGKVMEVARSLRSAGERPRIMVDSIGVGAGVVDQLSQQEDLEVVGVNVAESANDVGEYANLRSEISFMVADWLKSEGAIPPDGKLEGELVAPTYAFDLKGRMKVEPKDQIKKRLGRSPDRADALGLAIYGTRFRSSPNTESLILPRVSAVSGF